MITSLTQQIAKWVLTSSYSTISNNHVQTIKNHL